MSTAPKTHIIPTLVLLAAAALPAHPLATQSAYRDSEVSLDNLMQAAACFEDCVEVAVELFRVQVSEPQEVVADIVSEGEVAGETTEEPKKEEPLPEVEVSEEPVEVTEPELVEVETGGEPLEVVETSAEPVVADEPVKTDPEPPQQGPATETGPTQ